MVEGVTAQLGNVQPCDAVVSSDGRTMFVSDLQSAKVSRYRRGSVSVRVASPKVPGSVLAAVPASIAPGAAAPARPVTETPVAPKVQEMETAASSRVPEAVIAASTPEVAPMPATPVVAVTPVPAPAVPVSAAVPTSALSSSAAVAPVASTPAGGVPWEASPETAFARAAGTNKKVAIFLFTAESTKAREIDEKVFGDPGFFTQYPDVVWSKVDASLQPDVMRQYGLFKVPAVIVFSADKQELKRIEGLFTKEDFAAWFPPGR